MFTNAPDAQRVELVTSLSNLRDRFGEQKGGRGMWWSIQERIATLHRELFSERSNFSLLPLAEGLNKLAWSLYPSGRSTDDLTPAPESISLLRKPSSPDSTSAKHNPSASFGTIDVWLYDLSRFEEAVIYSKGEEVVDIGRFLDQSGETLGLNLRSPGDVWEGIRGFK